MSAAGILAGSAFVRLYINDESVQESLNNVKAKLKTFGAAVDSVGKASFVGMQTTAVASTAATTASVGVLAATMGVLRATVYAVGNAFRVVFMSITTSVTKATLMLGMVALTVSKLFPASKFAGLMKGFLNSSATTEAVGRWTRFFGVLSGSRALKGLGNRIERLGLGASIVKGFQGGLMSGLSATMGASFRSLKSIVMSGIASAITAPFRLAGTAISSVMKIGGGGSSGGAQGIAAGLGKVSLAGRAVGATASTISVFGSVLKSVAIKAGGFAAAITGPALLAARKFITDASEMSAKAKETGESLESLIAAKYGDQSIISAGDIEAGAALGDMMKTLKQAMAAAWAQIGIAALPVLKSMTENSIMVAQAIGQFLNKNRDLVTTIISTVAKIGAVAAGLGMLVAGFTAAGIILPMLLSPLGLITAGVAALIYFFPQVGQMAVSAFESVFGSFSELSDIVGTTMGGIRDAIAGGDLMLAGQVLWAGMYALWLQGTSKLRGAYDALVTGFSALFIDMWAGLETAWVNTTSFFLDTWVSVTRGMADIWTATQNQFAKGFATVIAKMTGQNVDDVLSTLDEMQNEEKAKSSSARSTADNEIKNRHAKEQAARDQIEKNRFDSREENQSMHDKKADAAAEALKASRDELDAARAKAAEVAKAAKVKPAGAGGKDEIKGLQDSTTLSSFSVAGVGRTNVGGVGALLKPLNVIAENTDPKNQQAWG